MTDDNRQTTEELIDALRDLSDGDVIGITTTDDDVTNPRVTVEHVEINDPQPTVDGGYTRGEIEIITHINTDHTPVTGEPPFPDSTMHITALADHRGRFERPHMVIFYRGADNEEGAPDETVRHHITRIPEDSDE